jgi:hypothetical protein
MPISGWLARNPRCEAGCCFGGATHTDNGILLCSSHRHRVHHDRWDIRVRDNVPYFIPPPHVDPHQRPRPGGRMRLPDAG